jgi:2,3-bisphosphoglycerate-dependent phosphoglycerate mutase
MQTAILVRHGESWFSVEGKVNGDPTADRGLTEAGRDQAAALGVLIRDDPIDLCVVTEFARTQETADIALAGREVPRLVVPELNDIRFGLFEGGAFADYIRWARSHGPTEDAPGGGESRVNAARRFVSGYRKVLERRETTVLVVAHGLPIRYVLGALMELDPVAKVDPVEHAEPFRVSAAQLERAVERLEAWTRNPVFA